MPREIATYAPTPAVFHNQVHLGSDVVLVRKDGSAVSVIDYWFETPEAVSLVMKGRRFGSIPLCDLDRHETARINLERGIQFRVARQGLP